MEQELYVIPTASKAKISHLLSYPIGADAITQTLEGATQMPLLRIQFYHWSDHHLREGKYEFLRVEYLNGPSPVAPYPIHLYRRPPQYRWEVVVQPVPRVWRHKIKTYILETAFVEMREWLLAREQLAQPGNDVLAFFFDEKKEEFEMCCMEKLEPLR